MSRLQVILLVSMVVNGCAVFKTTKTESRITTEETSGILNNIKSKNISISNFYIQRAEIEVIAEQKGQKLLASINYRKDDGYLISIKSRSGIEAARLYMTNDSVFINDRLSRKFYYGSMNALENKYGISGKGIPMLFGDIVYEWSDMNEEISCKDGKGIFEGFLGNRKLYYTTDCDIKKVTESEISNNSGKSGFIMNFSEFRKKGNIVYPAGIKIEDKERQTQIRIVINDIQSENGQEINFIPGKNYEKIVIK